MKKPNFLTIMTLFFLAPSLILATAAPVQLNNLSVKVALLSPQTGGLSAYTAGFEQAAALAIDDIGEMDEFEFMDFELKVYDTKTDPTGAATAMTQAVTDGATFAVGAAGSSNTLAAAAVAISEQVPLISYASTSPALTEFDDHAVAGDEGYLWRTPPSDALQGKVIADIANAGGHTTMVIVTLDNAYGIGLANSTQDEFEALGGTVSATIKYAETTTDFGTIVSQVATANPDIVVAISYATDGAQLFLAMAQQSVSAAVIGADGVADEGIFAEATGTAAAMEGFVLTKPSAKSSATADAFKAAYAAAYPTSTGDIYTGETYDAVMAGARAVLAACSLEGADIIHELSEISFAGATGTIAFDEHGDSKAGYYQVSQVQSGAVVDVAHWEVTLSYDDTAFQTAWTGGSALGLSGGLGLSQEKCGESDEDDSPFPALALLFGVFALPLIARRRQ